MLPPVAAPHLCDFPAEPDALVDHALIHILMDHANTLGGLGGWSHRAREPDHKSAPPSHRPSCRCRSRLALARGRKRQRGEGRFSDGLGGPGRGPGPPVMENLTMAKAIQKIAMNAAENIPYDKLVLSQKNVRRVKDGVSIEQLAEDIGRRKLLQSLNVRPVLDEERRGDRHVRSARRRPPLSRARHAHQAEAPGEERADPLHRQSQHGDIGGRGFAGRERPPRQPPSARPVPGVQDPQRPGSRSSKRSPPASSCRRRR